MRRRLFRALLAGCTSSVRSLEALQRQPRWNVAAFRYDVVLDLDIRDSPHAAVPPHSVTARRAYFSFADEWRIKKQVPLELYDASGSPFWQRCFEMAFRAACLVKGRAYAHDELLSCRDSFRNVPPWPATPPTRRLLERLLPAARADRPRLAVTPGGYNPPCKRWPVERFAAVIRHAVSRGVDVYVLGSRAEAHLARRLLELTAARLRRSRGRDSGRLTFLGGRLAPEDLPHLLQAMDVHLSNDNGVAHLGGILNRPQLILYRGVASPHLSVGFKDVTMFSGDEVGMEGITAAAVVETLGGMLRAHAGRGSSHAGGSGRNSFSPNCSR